MKRSAFERYLRENNCFLLREGSKHSIFLNNQSNSRSSVPRHNEIFDDMVKKICKDLGIHHPF